LSAFGGTVFLHKFPLPCLIPKHNRATNFYRSQNYHYLPPLSTILCRSFGMTFGMTLGLFFEHRENTVYPSKKQGLKTKQPEKPKITMV
jgi:hypothetical protein